MIPGGTILERIGLPIDTTCSNAPVNHTFDMPLAIGSVPIVKTLRLNDSAVSIYLARYLAANTCLKTYADFLDELMGQIDYSGCGGDYCAEECAAEVGPDPSTVSRSGSRGTGTSLSHAKAMADCLADCESYAPCEAGYNIMLADMRPGGQYATFTANSGGTYGDALSVFNDLNNIQGQGVYFGNDMTLGEFSWRKPIPPYHDDDGTPSQVLNNAGVLVSPESLTFPEFLASWHDSWAESLVGYHPEYCFYTWCVQNKASNDYDGKLLGTETCVDATAAGLLSDPLLADPYFASGGKGAGQRWAMVYQMTNYGGSGYSMKQMAIIQVHCGSCDPTSASQLAACVAAHTFGADAATCDDEWLALRDLYLATKQGMVESQRTVDVLASGPQCSKWIPAIGVIGTYVSYGTFGSGPSNSQTQGIYWTKTRRYQSATQMIGSAGSNTATIAGAARDSLDSLCSRQCESYADAWMAKLSPCLLSYPVSSADIMAIRNELIDVCRKGCDECSIFGSSTTKPGTFANAPHNDVSFDDVLRRHFGAGYANASCSADLITMPRE
jgi:hypothetical protein